MDKFFEITFSNCKKYGAANLEYAPDGGNPHFPTVKEYLNKYFCGDMIPLKNPMVGHQYLL